MIKEDSFSAFIKGQRVRLITLRSNTGLKAYVTNYGAKLVSLFVPDSNGQMADVLLGFPTLDEWREKETYFNAVIGRYANRIKNGQFTLDGQQYQLAVNNGTNHLHGGYEGFNKKEYKNGKSNLQSKRNKRTLLVKRI